MVACCSEAGQLPWRASSCNSGKTQAGHGSILADRHCASCYVLALLQGPPRQSCANNCGGGGGGGGGATSLAPNGLTLQLAPAAR